MPEGINLKAEVRRLLEVEAPVDPDAAVVQFHSLVATYGRDALGAALLAVAPGEVFELLGAQVSAPTGYR